MKIIPTILLLIPLLLQGFEPSIGLSSGTRHYTELRFTHQKQHQILLSQGITDTRVFFADIGYRFRKFHPSNFILSSGLSLSTLFEVNRLQWSLYLPITIDYNITSTISLFGEYGFSYKLSKTPQSELRCQIGIRLRFPALIHKKVKKINSFKQKNKPQKISKKIIASLKKKWLKEQKKHQSKQRLQRQKQERKNRQRKLAQKQKWYKLTQQKRFEARKMECETYYFYLLSLIHNYPNRAIFPQKPAQIFIKMGQQIKKILKKQRKKIIEQCIEQYQPKRIGCILQSQVLSKAIDCNDPLTLEYGQNLVKAGEYYRCNHWIKKLKFAFRGKKWLKRITPVGYYRPHEELKWFKQQLDHKRKHQKLCNQYAETVQFCVLSQKSPSNIVDCIPELRANRTLRHKKTEVTLIKPKIKKVETIEKNKKNKKVEKIPEKEPEKQKPSGVDLPW